MERSEENEALEAIALQPDNCMIWVQEEVFCFGVVPAELPKKLAAPEYLKRILIYCQNKGSLGYPMMNFSVWKHIAVNKIKIPLHVAWSYFAVFLYLKPRKFSEFRLWESRFARCKSAEAREALQCELQVDTLQFMIFLYIQQARESTTKKVRLSFSASSIGVEGWPLNPAQDGPRKGSYKKALDETWHLMFVKRNLENIMNLLQEEWSEVENTGHKAVSLDVVKALGFLLGVSLRNERKVLSLWKVLCSTGTSDMTGYDASLESFDQKRLLKWLLKHIEGNPFFISACIMKGSRLLWPAGVMDGRCQKGDKLKISTNSYIAPKRYHLVVMTQVSNKTIANASQSLQRATVKIHRSHCSYIYLLNPFRFVSVDKCHGCVLVLGPVRGILLVQGCRDTKVVAVCRQLIISECINCQFNVLTSSKPILAGNQNENVTLAPYNTFYPTLGNHMDVAHIGKELDLWHSPSVLAESNPSKSKCWKKLDPSEFQTFAIPFEMSGPTDKLPAQLPKAYLKTIHDKLDTLKNWQNLLDQKEITPRQSKMIRELLQLRFQEWVNNSEYKRELDGLESLSESVRTVTERKQSSRVLGLVPEGQDKN